MNVRLGKTIFGSFSKLLHEMEGQQFKVIEGAHLCQLVFMFGLTPKIEHRYCNNIPKGNRLPRGCRDIDRDLRKRALKCMRGGVYGN